MSVPLAALAVLAERLAGGETVQGLAELLRLLSDVSEDRKYMVKYMHPMTNERPLLQDIYLMVFRLWISPKPASRLEPVPGTLQQT